MRRLALACLLLPLALSAQADAYKCQLPDGRIEITDAPCRQGTVITVKPTEVIPPERRAAAIREVERQREQLEKREAAAARAAAAAAAAAPTAGDKAPPANAIDECLRELARQELPASQRAEREAACREKGGSEKASPATGEPAVGGLAARCLNDPAYAGLPQCRNFYQGMPVTGKPPRKPVPAKPAPPTPEPSYGLCPSGKPNCGKTP